MKKLLLVALVLCFTLSQCPGMAAATEAENAALQTVAKEISAARAGRSEYAENLGRYTDFNTDLKKVLQKYSQPGMPKTLNFNGKPAKILVPLNLDEKLVGGFFQLSTDGRKILSYLPWNKDMRPLFVIERSKWENAADAAQLPELAELMPITENHSAGVPVEKSDLTDLFLIDYIDMLPGKTQEELAAYTSTVGLNAHLGRRTGSSKCLGLFCQPGQRLVEHRNGQQAWQL